MKPHATTASSTARPAISGEPTSRSWPSVPCPATSANASTVAKPLRIVITSLTGIDFGRELHQRVVGAEQRHRRQHGEDAAAVVGGGGQGVLLRTRSSRWAFERRS
jgi:hypothetical protein